MRGDAQTWRQHLLAYNEHQGGTPQGILRAGRLYQNPAYAALLKMLGSKDLFILSAGWGLIPADFLTPDYDITFSSSADAARRRRKKDRFDDLCILDSESDDPIVFFGGKDYFPFFCALTGDYRGRRIAVYNSNEAPSWKGV